MRRAVLCALVLAAGCRASDPPRGGERFSSADDGFSCEVPDGWSSHADHGSIVFTSPAAERRTLAVRATATRPGVRTSAVLDATEVALRDLPEVQIVSRRPIDGPLPGTELQLSFVPPGSHARYVRTHVVLVGAHHVFHVIDTAPATSAPDDTLVTGLVASFREEG